VARRGALAARKRRLAAVGSGEVFGVVVGGEANDGVAFETVILEVLHYGPPDIVVHDHDDVGFLPCCLCVSRIFLLQRHGLRRELDDGRDYSGDSIRASIFPLSVPLNALLSFECQLRYYQ
jgi:hypothetical protein